MDLTTGKKWECAQCSKQFKSNKYLTRHMVTHDPDAKVTCEDCSKTFKNRRVLSSHKWYIHTNRKIPRCDTCHRVFATPAILQRHIDTTHITEEGPPFPCKFRGCEETYLHEDDLLEHVKTGHAKNPVRFPCTFCGKEFKTRVQLEAHIPTHSRTKKKEYKCATCGEFPSQGKYDTSPGDTFGKICPGRGTV
ncbi:zinc finger protein 708-like [Folsomia candida]|uniref:zinc finger protein 708-like n=1 Tax=Folsomia candida TaxID=158441 RepID=UPI0016052608|nr:zinc finger protein 708-like [Folsomia candida]